MQLSAGSRLALPIGSVILALLLWQYIVTIAQIPSWLLPAPTEVVQSAVEFFRALWSGAYITFFEATVGFCVATIFGLSLATLFVWLRPVRDAIFPLILILQSMPMIAVAPIIIVYLGPTDLTAKILIVFLISFFPIIVNTLVGLESAEPELVDLMRTMGAGRWDVFIKLRFPGAVPHIFSGLKIGVTSAVTGALVGELVGGNQGLGYLMNVAAGHIDMALMFAVLVALTLMTMILFYTVVGLNRVMTRWQDRSDTVVKAQG